MIKVESTPSIRPKVPTLASKGVDSQQSTSAVRGGIHSRGRGRNVQVGLKGGWISVVLFALQ